MKKRLKGLLALSMVIVMVLAMSTAVVSAAVTIEGEQGQTEDFNGGKLATGKELGTDNSGGIIKIDSTGKWLSSGDTNIEENMDATGAAPDWQETEYKANSTFVIPTISKTGYMTDLWNVTTGTTDEKYRMGSGKNGPIYTVFLEPIPIHYTVEFNPNGGEGTMAPTPFLYDTSKTLPANTFVRDGYTFKGWSTTTDGEVKYKDQASILNLASTEGARITLYAVWEELPKDDSPDAGDTFPAAPLLMLMLMSTGAAVAVKRRKA